MTLRSRGQLPTVIQMCDRLPLPVLKARPVLSAMMTAGLVFTGRRQELADWLDHCRQQSALPFADRLYGEVLRGLDPVLAFFRGDLDACTELARQNWPQQQDANVLDRATLAYINAYSCLWRGELDDAAAFLIVARRDCGLGNSIMGLALVCFLQSYLDAIEGNLDAAEQQLATLEKIGSQYSEQIPPVLLYLFSAGLLLMMKYERNELDTVGLRLQMANGIILIGLPWESHSGVLLVQARMLAIEQGPAVAKHWLETEITAGSSRQLPPLARSVLEGELSRLSILLDAPGQVAGYARLLDDSSAGEQHILPCQEIDGAGIAQVRLMIYTGALDHALHCRRHWRAAKLRLLLAIALERQGQPRAAEEVLAPALEQAARSGLIRSFLDEGEAALVLLHRMQTRARHVLSAAAVVHLDKLLRLSDLPASTVKPTEELTQTECALLTMVAHGKTNKEIGDVLFLSVNTVKWHMGRQRPARHRHHGGNQRSEHRADAGYRAGQRGRDADGRGDPAKRGAG